MLNVVPELVVHSRSLLGSRENWLLGSGLSMREKGKRWKYQVDVHLLWAACKAPMSMKTGSWVVSSVDVSTRRGHSVSTGGRFICCEF